MDQNHLNAYVQKIIEPLYAKIQLLQKQNQQLKRRVTCLEASSSINGSQSPRSYMKNTLSRDNRLQDSRVTKRDDDNRSVSGSKDKNGWKSTTKLQEEKIISKQISQHERFKTKPPIPRMVSKTPTKTQDQVKRATSPPVDKKIIGGAKAQTEYKEILVTPKKVSQIKESIQSPLKQEENGRYFDDPSASNVSKSNSMKLGAPNIYIQKQSKLNTVSSSGRQTPLGQSACTDKQGNSGSVVTQDNSSQKLIKSQLSINSEKKTSTMQVAN